MWRNSDCQLNARELWMCVLGELCGSTARKVTQSTLITLSNRSELLGSLFSRKMQESRINLFGINFLYYMIGCIRTIMNGYLNISWAQTTVQFRIGVSPK